MHCEFCGEEVSEGALACPRCGSPASKPPGQEKPATITTSADLQPQPADAPARGPRAPVPQTPPAQSPQTDAGPALEPHFEPPHVPLAKQEEEFIALAEEKAQPEEAGAQPPDSSAGVLGTNGILSPEAAIIENNIAPGPDADPQKMVVEDDLAGGHKGGAFTGASVAGAGVQTANDPFGLNVTETAPPAATENEAGKQFNWAKWYNILMMIVAFLVAGAVATTGVYFGFIRKKNAPVTDPVETVTKYCSQVVSGDTSKLNDISTPGSSYQKDLSDVLDPYAKLGVLSMKEFKATTTETTGTNATVEIKKFVVRSLSTNGETEYLDMLSINDPARLRTTVSLVKQNGKWLVRN